MEPRDGVAKADDGSKGRGGAMGPEVEVEPGDPSYWEKLVT